MLISTPKALQRPQILLPQRLLPQGEFLSPLLTMALLVMGSASIFVTCYLAPPKPSKAP